MLDEKDRIALSRALPILKRVWQAPEIVPPTDTSDEGLKAYAIETSTTLKAAKQVTKLFEDAERLIESSIESEKEEENKRHEEFVAKTEEEKRTVGTNL